MSTHLAYPKLRWPLDVRLERYEGQEILIVSCPLGVSSSPLLLVPAVAPIVAALDGSLSIDALLQKFAPFGVQRALIDQLLTLLDQNLFLMSPAYERALTEQREAFRRAPERAAAQAGLGYPGKPEALAEMVRGYLTSASSLQPPAALLALMAPHIDYRRGGACYGATYSRLMPEHHDLFVLIGTCHQYSSSIFQLTAKHFQTPLGALPCDIDAAQRLIAGYGVERALRDEHLHRREHSLELQTPFLRYLNSHAQILPILVGSFQQMLDVGRYPEKYEEYEAFTSTLAAVLRDRRTQECGKLGRVCIVAGVDMAHVGGRFGDREPLTPERMNEIEQRDQQYLAALRACDRHALFNHIAEDGDRRRICGFPTMYTVLDLLERVGAQVEPALIEYRQAVDYDNQCAVTFAGMEFREKTLAGATVSP